MFIFFFSTIVSKPKEFAHLIKNKFGSADNIANLSKSVFVLLKQNVLLLIALIIMYLFNNYYGKIYKFIGLLEWFKKRDHTEIFLMAFRGYLEPKVSYKWFLKRGHTDIFLMAI